MHRTLVRPEGDDAMTELGEGGILLKPMRSKRLPVVDPRITVSLLRSGHGLYSDSPGVSRRALSFW